MCIRDRVIYVIPYTSIIEQNAAVFREILGDSNVLEHHSNMDDFTAEGLEETEELKAMHLAAENWDKPVIVTTNVQFFESLYGSRSSRCRNCLLYTSSPLEAESHGGICPVCKKKMTMGVSHRIDQLADRPEGFLPERRKPFESLVPLPEVIAASTGRSAAVSYTHLGATRDGWTEYNEKARLTGGNIP